MAKTTKVISIAGPILISVFWGFLPAIAYDPAVQPAAGYPQSFSAPVKKYSTQKLSSIAKIALGEVDNSYTDDKTKYNRYNGNQWCAAFVSWVYNKAGHKMPMIESSRGIISWFKQNGHSTFTDMSKARSGDIVVWKNGDGGHTGIVISNDGENITTVEGNGPHDEVRLRVHSYSEVRNNLSGLLGFGRW